MGEGQALLGSEYKVEVNCREDTLIEVIKAVRDMHPYEEP